MKNLRVHQLAKELGMTNAETVNLCQKLGMPVKSHSSSLNEAYADMVRRRAKRDGLTRNEPPAEPKKKPAKKAAANTAFRIDSTLSVNRDEWEDDEVWIEEEREAQRAKHAVRKLLEPYSDVAEWINPSTLLGIALDSDDVHIQGMSIPDLLQSLPRVRRSHYPEFFGVNAILAHKIARDVGIATGRSVKQLGSKQRSALLEMLDEIAFRRRNVAGPSFP